MEYLESDAPLLVIIGPSGAGKSTVIQELARQGIIDVTPTWTTRPPRIGEVETAIEHKFVTEQELDEHERRGHFLQVVKLFGLPYRYALPRVQKPTADRIPLIMMRASVLSLVPQFYSSVTIYQIEDGEETIAKRLGERKSSGEPLGTRLADYHEEVDVGRRAAHRVFVNDRDISSLADGISQAIYEDFRHS